MTCSDILRCNSPACAMRPTLLLTAACLSDSSAFSAQSVRSARKTRPSRPLRLCAHKDNELDVWPHQDLLAGNLNRERYLRAVECSKTDGLCDVEEMNVLASEFEHVFDDGIACSQEFEQLANNFVPDMYSDLKQRMKELNIKVNKITSDYRQANKDDWEQYLGGIYGTSGLSS